MTTSIPTALDVRDISALLDRLDPGPRACAVEGCVHHTAPPLQRH